MEYDNMQDIMKSKLVDIADGTVTTAFIFKRKDVTLHGFRVPTRDIELKDFTIRSSDKGGKHDRRDKNKRNARL